MSIIFTCENCQKKLKVPQSASGKRARCSQCGHLNTVLAVASAETIPDNTAGNAGPAPQPIGRGTAATYNVKSAVNGAVFGPANSATLQGWLDEGRITPNCQLQKTGTQSWTPASAMFPTLGAAAGGLGDAFADFKQSGQTPQKSGELNPYAPALSPSVSRGLKTSRKIVPTFGDIGFCISHGWKVWKENFGLLLATILTMLGVGLVLGLGKEALVFAVDRDATTFALIGCYIVTNLISMWLMLGFIKVVCQMARGERAEYSQLFSRGGRLPLTILVLLPFWVSGAAWEVYAYGMRHGGNPEEFGRVMLSFAGVMMLISLFTWPIIFLLADADLGSECVTKGLSIGARNCLIVIPIVIVASLISLSGLIACGIGVVATIPAMYTIQCTAYLNMSSQLVPECSASRR